MLNRILASILTITLFPVAASADPCGDMVGMYSRMAAATSYRETKVSPGGPTVKTEFMAPDRTHTDAGGHETIVIGNRTWNRLAGHWYSDEGSGKYKTHGQIWQAAVDSGAMMQSCRSADLEDLGIVNGLHVYRMNAPKFGVQNVMYLGSDSLPVKIEVTTRGKTYVTTYSDWNVPISIDPPK